MDTPQEAFLSLSVMLTGFERIELQGTGMLEEYYERVCKGTDYMKLQRLWAIAQQLQRHAATAEKTKDPTFEIKHLLMYDSEMGPLARNIIKLWYRGDWPDSSARFGTSYTSVQAYQEGLLWKAMGSHAAGAKQPGFGSWSTPPPIRHSAHRENANDVES
jgi:hypothetical protein